MIAENLINLRKRIDLICQRCGRESKEIQLVAVSKNFSETAIQEAVQAGQIEIAENYVQELQTKRNALSAYPIHWHFVGHLQSNKVKYIAEYIHLIHSVDDFGLGKEIQKRASQHHRIQDILVEVHTTDEATKYGVKVERALDLVKELSKLENVRIKGLMTMGPFSDNPNESRTSFRQLKELSNTIESVGIENVSMKQLSMGMTHDFEVAIEEGSTILRIGTAIFGRRMKDVQ